MSIRKKSGDPGPKLPPGLHPKAQADYERTSKWAQPYYQRWAARVRSEMEAELRAGGIPDEMLNDLSEGEDEDDETAALRRHAPTPISIPSSPVISSTPKPINPTISIPLSSSFDRFGQEDGISPIDVDVRAAGGYVRSCWQASQSPKNRRRRIGHNKNSSVLTRSHVDSKSQFFRLPSTGAFKRISTRSVASSSTRYRSLSPLGHGGLGLQKMRRGRISKQRQQS